VRANPDGVSTNGPQSTNKNLERRQKGAECTSSLKSSQARPRALSLTGGVGQPHGPSLAVWLATTQHAPGRNASKNVEHQHKPNHRQRPAQNGLRRT